MSVYSDLILSDADLLSYWRLNEVAGTTAIDSTGVVDGTHGGSPSVIVAQPSLRANDPNERSYRFDHSFPGTLSFGDVYDFAGTTPFAAELWARPRHADTDAYLIVKGQDTGGWQIQYSFPNALARRYDAGGAQDAAQFSDSKVPDPIHLLMNYYDADTLEMWANGILAQSVASTRAVGNVAFDLQVGSFNSGGGAGSGFDGWMQDIALYGARKTQEQIATHFHGGAGLDGIPLLDAFDRANASPATGWNPVTGSDPMRIVSAALTGSGAAYSKGCWPTVFKTPCAYDITISSGLTGGGIIECMWHLSDNGGVAPIREANFNGYKVYTNFPDLNFVEVRRYDNGSGTVVARGWVKETMTNGDRLGIRALPGGRHQILWAKEGGPFQVVAEFVDANYTSGVFMAGTDNTGNNAFNVFGGGALGGTPGFTRA